MKILKTVITSVSLVALLTVPASMTVYAHGGEADDDNSGSGRTKTVLATESTTTTSSDDTKVEDSVKTELKNRGKQQVDELRKKGQQKSQAARETACNSSKKGAQQRISAISANTARFQTKLDTIFTKAQAYVTDKNLTVENYDALVAAVKTAQTTSAESVAALKALQPTIDCTQTTNAENVAAFRTAAHDTRDKLKAYMKSLKELLKAVRDAKHAAHTTTNTNTNTNTETETEGSTN